MLTRWLTPVGHALLFLVLPYLSFYFHAALSYHETYFVWYLNIAFRSSLLSFLRTSLAWQAEVHIFMES